MSPPTIPVDPKLLCNAGMFCEEVMWWSALTEAPTDVLEFLEFLVTRFPSTRDAYFFVAGVGQQGIANREYIYLPPVLAIGCVHIFI